MNIKTHFKLFLENRLLHIKQNAIPILCVYISFYFTIFYNIHPREIFVQRLCKCTTNNDMQYTMTKVFSALKKMLGRGKKCFDGNRKCLEKLCVLPCLLTSWNFQTPVISPAGLRWFKTGSFLVAEGTCLVSMSQAHWLLFQFTCRTHSLFTVPNIIVTWTQWFILQFNWTKEQGGYCAFQAFLVWGLLCSHF